MHRSGDTLSRSGRSPPLAVGAVALALGLGGCTGGGADEGGPTGRALLSGRRASPISAPQLSAVRRAAQGFARSYAASIRDPSGTVVRDATPALARDLRALRTRVPRRRLGDSPRVTAVVVTPRSASRAEATVILDRGSGSPFPIVFVLRRIEGRWLAARLPGN